MKNIMLLVFMSAPIFAQLEPCGFFEVNDIPGFDHQDLAYCGSLWLSEEPETDFDNDGSTRILDMIRMVNCVGGLNHGLIGKYYGFNTGDGSGMTYPNFSSMSDPVVVRPTEKLYHLPNNWNSLMDSEMVDNSAAVFEGYLFIPEDDDYFFQINGYRGMKLFIDGQYVTGFENGWATPHEGNLMLSYGLHTIKVEYFTADHPGSIVLQWRAVGDLQYSVLDQTNLYHETAIVPALASTGLEGLFFPSSGGRTSQSTLSLSTWFMGPNSDIHVTYGGQELVLQDGFWSADMALEPGLNELTFQVMDGEGREKTIPYFIYSDTEVPVLNGLVARLYGEEYDVSPIPEIDNLHPFAQTAVSGCQIDGPTIGGEFTSNAVLCHLEGTIHIDEAGTYGFRINNTGSLRINGHSVCNLDGEYRRQWQPSGSVYLEAGNHHFHLHTAQVWRSPTIGVYWTPLSGTEVLIPDSQFHYASSYFLPDPITDPPDINGRVRAGLVAEYLLRDGDFFRDSSGNEYTLEDDWRVEKQAPGGAKISIGGGLISEQGGVHAAHQLTSNLGMTFEAEVIWNGETPSDWNTRNLFSVLLTYGTPIAGFQIRNDYLVFHVSDYDDWQLDGNVYLDNFVNDYKDQRVHIAGTWDGNTMTLYLNGQPIGSVVTQCRVDQWRKVAWLSIGNPTAFWHWGEPNGNDYHFDGSILMAAMYDRPLSAVEVLSNYQANQTLIDPPVTVAPIRPAFPPTGTTQAQLEEAHHVLNRLSFGPDQTSLEEILNSGVDAWILNQLNSDTIDDSKLDTYLSSIDLRQATSSKGFIAEMLLRAVYSKKQLQEVMAQFWENHFNTELAKVNYPEEDWLENGLFREHALGSFRDLLLSSGTSYPMNVYLDNIYNVVGAPNENYAREIFELHTFGANNGYTQEDIEQAARCFTGWSIKGGKFHFYPGLHDFGEKYLPSLNLTIPAGGGLIDGMLLIDELIQSQECADFVTWKMCQILIDDDPPSDVNAAASATFLASNGDIKQVLNTILAHPRFRTDFAYRQNKVKTPLEFMVSTVRVTESYPSLHGMDYYLEKMGMEIFNYSFPTGFEEAGSFWVNTNSLLFRWNFVHHVTSNRGNGNVAAMDIRRFVNSRGLNTSTEIMNLFEGLTTHGRQEATVFDILEDHLTDGDPGSFSVTPQTIDQEIRHTLSLFLRLPEYNRQ